MRWTDGLEGDERRRFAPSPSRIVPALALLLLVVLPLQPQSSSGLQRLSVYAPRGSFTVPLQQNAGRDYVGILDLLDPLGQLSARQDGRKWKMRFNGT
ncbi:MAG TPA: hypothetical protein VJP83_01525, partial [Terriglobales bacterium]|nr:hypothetical protein [Terriglobales bacterium]